MSLKPNTSISYQYRDADNYKTSREVVLAGTLTDEQIEAILARRSDGQFFIPSQVELEDLQETLQAYDTTPSEADHAWHELEREDFAATDADPTTSLTVAELAANFAAVEWDETDPSLPFDLNG